MKIAFFTDCFLDLTGGITSSINAQKTALEQHGHTVYIFSTGFVKPKDKLQELAQKNIFQVPSCRLFFRGLTPVSRRPKIIEKWLLKNYPEIKDFDIYYIHYESGCSIAGLRLGKKLKIPTVQVMHGREDMGEPNIIPPGFRTIVAILLNWFHSWYLPHPIKIHLDDYLATTLAKTKMWEIMINHANYADFALTPSKHFRQKLIHYGVKNPIEVFPNGFSDQLSPQKITAKKLNPNEKLKIIWHSRVSSEKRIIPFFQALKNFPGQYHLDVYGIGRELPHAKLYAKQYNIHATFHGDVPFKKLIKAIEESHLDVLTSYNSDTFGMTLIEAEAFGVPVFFCDPDMKEIVPAGSYIMSSGKSPEKMAEALKTLFDHPEKIQQMSEVMLKHRKEILISNRIDILENIFKKILSQK